MDSIEINGYKSIKHLNIDLRPVNILIGSNGAGKSNFISFFEFLNNLYERKLQQYVATHGGMAKFLHKGLKITYGVQAKLTFNNGINHYSFELGKGDGEFIFDNEDLGYNGSNWKISSFNTEANIKTNDSLRADYIREHLSNLRKYHFHDTGKNSPFTELSNIETDSYFLYETGQNLAAFLYGILENNSIVYKRIIRVIQSIAPYFSDFFFQPNENGFLRLTWQDQYSSTVYSAADLSDGTLRFIALTTLFMQPDLPATIIIDEPELGLHPVAIAKLAGMIKSVEQKGTQVIVATQSSDLVNHFSPEEVITVDMEDGESQFNRLNQETLSVWMEDYALGDLWKRNIIATGQP